MRIRFLGTGAADWHGPDEHGETRRFSSVLVNGSLQIDCGADAMCLSDTAPEALFLTHSHADHYSPEGIARLCPGAVYAHESWAQGAQQEGIPAVGVAFGAAVQVAGMQVTPLPAGHSTDRDGEEPCLYWLREGSTNVLYATDGAWLPRQSVLLLGDTVLDSLIIDATCGPDHPDDWRVFEHNSLAMVRILAEGLHRRGNLRQDAPVVLTHLARTLWPGQEEAQRAAEPFLVAWDGMEITV